MDVQPHLDRLVAAVAGDPRVIAVMLFGSRARGDHHAGSDVDVCLVIDPSLRDRREATRVRLDYLAHSDVSLHVFQQLPLYVRHRVLKEGRTLWVRDEDALYDVAFATVRAWGSFRRHYEAYLEEVGRGRP